MSSAHRSIAAVLGSLALLWTSAALADATVKINNNSKKAWSLRAVADGSGVGGRLQFGGKTCAPGSSISLPPGKALEMTYKYGLSYQVRFQLVDENRNWAEFESGVAKASSFSTSMRCTFLSDSIGDAKGDEVGSVLDLNRDPDSRHFGDITIKGDHLPGQAALACPAGSLPPKLKAPFWTTYWFNPTRGDYVVKAAQAQAGGTGEVIFTDMDGNELGRLPNRRSPTFKIPARSMARVLYVPGGDGACRLRLTLADKAGKVFVLDTAHGELSFDQEAQTSEAAKEAAAGASIKGLDQEKFLHLGEAPDEGDLTFLHDAFPF